MFLSKRGKYWYVIYLDELTGRRKVITTKAKLKSDAFKFLSEFTERLKPKPRVIALSDLRSEVLNHVRYHLRKTSILLYESTFRNMERQWGNILIKFIYPNQIEKYKINRLNNGVKKSTVNIELRTMHAMFNLSVQWGFIQSNPCKGVKKFQIDEKEKLAFSEIEVRRILDHAKDKKFKNILTFALNTGCRLDEIICLQWRDVDFDQEVIIIGNKEVFKTKTGKKRYIPISIQLFEVLNSIKPPNISECLDNYVFGKSRYYKYDKSYISKKFKSLLRQLKFPERFHFHCLRHTFITQLVKKGVNIYDIKQLAGHSCIETTESYMHTITEDLRKAVNLLNI